MRSPETFIAKSNEATTEESCAQGRLDADDDALHDVLHGEDVAEQAIVALASDVVARGDLDELGRDAHRVLDLAHAALEEVPGAELLSRIRRSDGVRAATARLLRDCHDGDVGKFREVGDQVFS